MKAFLLGLALISGATAIIGIDCSNDARKCETTECCGYATKDKYFLDGTTANWAKDGVVRVVCNTKTATYWVETITAASPTYYESIS